jgi:GT2 family glycosyltransferase
LINNGKVLSSQIDVSIIIINYNEDELLRQCIIPIVEYTKEVACEIIVVDNGSTIGDIDFVTKEFQSVKLIKNKKNLGFGAANNIGTIHAQGKYILFLNNDTKLISNSIKEVFDFAEKKHSNSIFVGCQLLNADRSKQESVFDFPSVWNSFTENFYLYKFFPKSKWFNKYYQNYYDYSEPTEVDVIRGAFMFCPAREIKELNGFDERFFFYSEETDLCYRFKKERKKIYFLPKTAIIHFGGATTDKNLWFKFKNQTIGKIQYYQKHFDGLRFALAILFHFLGLFFRWLQNIIAGLLLFRRDLMIKGYYFLRQMFVYPKNSFKDFKYKN